MKNFILKAIIVLGVVVNLSSCTKDFDEINTNPNAPTAVNSSLLLPQVVRDMMNSLLGESWGIGNIVIQHTAKNQFVNEDRYLWGELNSIWNSVYSQMRDLNNILVQSEELGQNNYKGIALVLKSWMFSLATDCYGDIPYSQAVQAKNGINYPVYDTQESIYEGILADLEEANQILGSSGEVVAGDVIFDGDILKWRKLANSLRVRFLMRISNKRDVSGELAKIVGNPSDYPLFEGVADNAVYTYLSSSPGQFPKFTNRIGSFNELRASETMLDTLVSLDDERLYIFFRSTPETEGTTNPEYVGIPNGLDDVSALQYNGGPQAQSRISALYFEEAVTSKGLEVAKGVIMTYAELQFLLAEAAEKGMITGDAGQYYTNGVKASFEFYGLEATDSYLNQPQVAYTGSSTEKLDKIGFQKWISLFYQGLEAWFDWRRTGRPALTPSVDNQNVDKIPVRFIYPILEQALNGGNRDAAVARQGVDDINTKMWYLK
ncbi:MAG: SusD/RagB family nutrient-binding outer membrane lipoprotein [Saprospirales bacterium]|nr:SusD/RagB family nutrient-binding outer membrane lipoprotein [Saprospirales bacterium]